MDYKKYLHIVAAVLFIGGIFFLLNYTGRNVRGTDIKYVNIGNSKVAVEVALTPAAQELGLGGRKDLGANEGMLFVFEQPDKYYFWMKGMNFPLDIIWIDANMRVIYIKKNAMPAKVLENFGPDQNSKYVLEVNTGYTDKHNIKVGDSVRFAN